MVDAITPKVRSIENMVKRARSTSRGTPESPACPVCHSAMWISFFFDGTGNHAAMQFPNSHSNVAALRDAHVNNEKDGIYVRYYEGLGTPFEFNDRYEEVLAGRGGKIKKVGYQESGKGLQAIRGLGFADGITERLEKATFDFIRDVDDYRARQRVDSINLAAFGFSRGATEARVFVNWISRISGVESKANQLTYHGIPLNVAFLGIFDTVESVGMAADNKMPELLKTTLPPYLKKCTHIVAAHELRHAFPLTVTGVNHIQVVYPGAHADVGGGYGPNDQGRSNTLARVALMQMLDEARGAGLKMMSLGEMKSSKLWARMFQPSFGVHDDANRALQAYLGVTKPSGDINSHMEAHMREYWKWIDSGQAVADLTKKRERWRGSSDVIKSLGVMNHLLTFKARTQEGRGQGTATTGPSPAVSHLFANYIHDSFEHFSATGGTLQTDLSDTDYYKRRTQLAPTT